MSYKSIYKSERKKVFFSKQFSKFRATNNSNVQIKRLLQNKTTDYNICTYIKTTLFIANLLIRNTWHPLFLFFSRLRSYFETTYAHRKSLIAAPMIAVIITKLWRNLFTHIVHSSRRTKWFFLTFIPYFTNLLKFFLRVLKI